MDKDFVSARRFSSKLGRISADEVRPHDQNLVVNTYRGETWYALPTEPVATAAPFATAAVLVATTTLAAPAMYAAQAPVVEYIAPAPAVYAAPAACRASTRICTPGDGRRRCRGRDVQRLRGMV